MVKRFGPLGQIVWGRLLQVVGWHLVILFSIILLVGTFSESTNNDPGGRIVALLLCGGIVWGGARMIKKGNTVIYEQKRQSQDARAAAHLSTSVMPHQVVPVSRATAESIREVTCPSCGATNRIASRTAVSNCEYCQVRLRKKS